MLDFVLRKSVYENVSEYKKNAVMLSKDRIKMNLLSLILISFFVAYPLGLMLSLLFLFFTHSYSILNIFIIISLIIVYICLIKGFSDIIEKFRLKIYASLYFNKYVTKGKAISKKDFEDIKKADINLYSRLKQIKTEGICYWTCFELLKCLKKGHIQFVRIRVVEDDEIKKHGKYTMHVLYVNNNWCFDTISGKQHPLEEALNRRYAKTYTIYSYDDIKNNSYEEFKRNELAALRDWCKQNDCSEGW